MYFYRKYHSCTNTQGGKHADSCYSSSNGDSLYINNILRKFIYEIFIFASGIFK